MLTKDNIKTLRAGFHSTKVAKKINDKRLKIKEDSSMNWKRRGLLKSTRYEVQSTTILIYDWTIDYLQFLGHKNVETY